MGKNLKLLKAEMVTNKDVYEEGDSIVLKTSIGVKDPRVVNTPMLKIKIGEENIILLGAECDDKMSYIFTHKVTPKNNGEIKIDDRIFNCRIEHGNDLILNDFIEPINMVGSVFSKYIDPIKKIKKQNIVKEENKNKFTLNINLNRTHFKLNFWYWLFCLSFLTNCILILKDI